MPRRRRRLPFYRRCVAFGLALTCSGFGPRAARAAEPPSGEACMRAYEGAQRTRLKKKLLASKGELLVCSHAACPDFLRRDCTKWLSEVEAALPSVVVVVRSGNEEISDAELRIDDEIVALEGSAINVDPGEHVFHVEASNGRSQQRKILISEAEKNRSIEFDFPKEAETESKGRNLIPVYGLATLGVIGIGSFAFFGLRAHSRKQDLESCKGHCPVDDVDAVRRDQIVGDVSLGLGLIALGGAAWIYFGSSSESKAPPSSGWHMRVSPIARGAALSLGTSY